MALFVVRNFFNSNFSCNNVLGLSQKFYVRNFGYIPEGILFISTHDTVSLIQIDEKNIKSVMFNNKQHTFQAPCLRNVLLKDEDVLEIFFENPTGLIQSVKLSHISSALCQRELGIA